MFSALCWRCACRLRVLSRSRKGWSSCGSRLEIVVLAAKPFHSTPTLAAENTLLEFSSQKELLAEGDGKVTDSYHQSLPKTEDLHIAHRSMQDRESSAVFDDGAIPSAQQLTKHDLRRLADSFGRRETIRQAATELGVPEIIYQKCLRGFKSTISSPSSSAADTHLHQLLLNIHRGSAHLDDLFPHFMKYAHERYPALTIMPELQKISNLTHPHMWYPRARSFKRRFIFHAGPTNSGKTHSALEQFLTAQSAIYCAPLRMLAHEIYQRSNKRGVACDLLTGEERQLASGSEDLPSSHMSCTVEMADVDSYYDVGVVDEVQMIQDEERGGAWTRAILGLPAQEIHLCGHESAVPLIRRLTDSMGDELEVCKYERLCPLVPLEQSLAGNFQRVRPGDCMVVFSRRKIFHIRRQIERATQEPCAVIYGGLPAVTRVQQAELFNESGNHCQIMVATDAIGMGLNLNIRRIIFYDVHKFDGSEHRELTSAHIKQIAGRAGRYGLDHAQGEVTTFFEHNLETLHKSLTCSEDNITQAGIYPTYEQIEHFSHLLPQASFLDLLTLFFKMAQLDGTFFLCDVQRQLDIAARLQGLKLSLRDMYRLSKAPVEKDHHMNMLYKCAADYNHGEVVTFSRLCEIISWPQRPPLSTIQLAIFEQTHEAIDLYLWLCMRFPDCFVAVAEARELQKHIQEEIALYIVNRSRPRAVMNKLNDEGSQWSRRRRHRGYTKGAVRHYSHQQRPPTESKSNQKEQRKLH